MAEQMSVEKAKTYREHKRPQPSVWRRICVICVAVLLQIVLLAPLCAEAGSGSQDRRLRARILLQHGISQYQKGRYHAAIAALEEVKRLMPRERKMRYYLARAHIQQGDHLRSRGHLVQQREHYKQALDVDPRLLEDAAFVKAYKALQIEEAPPRPKRPPFKQRIFGFGLGVTLGVEGLLGLQVGGLFVGMLNPLITFSPVLRSLDLTLRIIPLRQFAWSPYISGGVTLPIPFTRSQNRFHIEAPTLHASVGVHYIAPIGLSFTAGVSFTYNFAQNIDAPFLPMPSVQLSWYF